MSVPSVPPPTYSQQHQTNNFADRTTLSASEAQLLISPSPNIFQFQKGYLGAEGERAAIEGEIEIKGVRNDIWESATISLHSYESVGQHQVELNAVELTLFSRSTPSSLATLPSSIPFSIPLTPDTPQCIHTARSSIRHTLTATLHPIDHSSPPLSRTITAHTRRYTSHLLAFKISPHTVTMNYPTLVEVQVPRTTYRTNETIPIYFTIPPPDRSVVMDQGFTLRNVRAELIRRVTVFHNEAGETLLNPESSEDTSDTSSDTSSSSEGEPPSAAFMASSEKGSSSRGMSLLNSSDHTSKRGTSHETVTSRSGASCRFHSSRPIKLRLLLYSSSQTTPPPTFLSELPEIDYGHPGNDTQCASISQTTLFHSVSFQLQVHATFVQSSNHSEHVATSFIPITLVSAPASLPQVEPSFDAAYRKKHDQPPTRTVRQEDSDILYTDHDGNQAGPSALQTGAPPPFDDAPPPFSSSAPEPSTSSRLPTFQESETDLHLPLESDTADSDSLSLSLPAERSIEGEGDIFGFLPAQQYDGHSDEMRQSSTPPPTMEMARDDTDVTQLASLVNQPDRALEALNMAFERESTNAEDLPPPPPPLMDDPSDPPPSIDSEFRSHASDPPPSIDSDFRSSAGEGISPSTSSSSLPPQPNNQSADLLHPINDPPAARNQVPSSTPSQAPPPYLIPANLPEHDEHVTRPPPYVDLVPSADDSSRLS